MTHSGWDGRVCKYVHKNDSLLLFSESLEVGAVEGGGGDFPNQGPRVSSMCFGSKTKGVVTAFASSKSNRLWLWPLWSMSVLD